MKKWMILLVGLLLIAGCSGAGGEAETKPEETTPVEVQELSGKVVAEAAIEPAQWSELRFEGSGTVVEVLVAEGDRVTEDDLLARLDPVDAELAIRQAEAAVAVAEAQLEQVKVGPRPEQFDELEAQVAASEAALAQAMAQQDELAAGETEAEVTAAWTRLKAAEHDQYYAEEQHVATFRCYEIPTRSGGKRTICPGEDFEEDARYGVLAANAALAAAQAQLAAARDGGEARLRTAEARVAAAAAQVDVTQAELDLLAAGIAPEDIAVSEAAVRQAEIAVTRAKAALERLEIRAPFAGTITTLNVEVGEATTPGQVIVVLATLDDLYARTVDLTELDVARVSEGQPAVVTVDALPDVQFTGHVARIDLQAVDYRGDVTYPVTVELDEVAPELRWGMTALVEIEVD
jgi:multidrug efflux pump subunit AcrA (membrane-fusion protein)